MTARSTGSAAPFVFFEEPVTVYTGLGFAMQVQGVKEAYALLCEWPPSKRNAAHAIAFNACKAVLLGEIDAETARGTFMALAARNDPVASEAEGVIAAGEVAAFATGPRAWG